MPELSRRRRMLVLAICCLSLFIFGVDSTIVNVALPSIQRDLHAPVSGLQWTVDAYTVVIASVLILAGSTADRFGRRKVFQIGLATFTLGSLLCSLAPGLGWLVAFRMLQAVGGSMMNPVAVSIIANTFTDPRERARAIGIWGGVFGLSIAAGPPLGGVLVDSVGWRGIFWVNIPVGVAAIVLTALFVPESRAARPRRARPGRPGAGHRDAGLAHLRDHRGPARGLDLPGDRGPVRGGRRRGRRADRLRAAAEGAAAGSQVLPQRAVHRRHADRRQRPRRPRRLPVPQHPVPAGRARPVRR